MQKQFNTKQKIKNKKNEDTITYMIFKNNAKQYET